ncbi:nitrogen fixation protein NifX [Formivibrio citricus]|uniref:Nitrogen fixation protein NifX n=1 Tax=Formivibrio citricus TaxID=83765 RepID=A0A1I4Z0U2_9NEIS|nr:NifB/NifX family molybdenum-iron cluster-binding protein [Formivibrio citricus]SFN43579.1 nitrogen fixation protein NifX [Formivibrio citricus]
MSTRLAFASSDGNRVDDHFGSAHRFHVYALNPEGAQRNAIIQCDVGEGHDSGRLARRIAALQGCRAVLCTEIGQSALRLLREAGIDVVRVTEGAAISDLLADWAAGRIGLAPASTDAARFERFLEEGWAE